MPEPQRFTDADYLAIFKDAASEILRDITGETPQWAITSRQSPIRVATAPINISIGLSGGVVGHLNFALERPAAKAMATAVKKAASDLSRWPA